MKLEKLPGEIHECVNYLFYQNNLFIAEDIFSAVFSEGNLFKVTKNFFNLKLQGFYNNLNIQVNEKYIH